MRPYSTGGVFFGHTLFFFSLLSVLVFQWFSCPQRDFMGWVESSGTILQIAIPSYVLVPVLWKRDGEGALRMLAFLALILIVTYMLKYLVPEKRPYGGSMSFPSGHTAGAFCGAVFLSLRYGLRYYFCAVPFALFVAYSRVLSHNHWPTDVIASIFFCVVLGFILVKPFKEVPFQG